KSQRYASLEMERYEERERRREEGEADDSDGDDGDGAYDSEEEREALLGLTPLDRRPSHASTMPDDSEQPPPPASGKEKAVMVSWSDLPKKGQLTLLTLAR